MSSNQPINQPSVVPTHITVLLGVLALALSLAGYVVQLLVITDKLTILWHALKVVPVFMVLIPAGICIGAYLMNRFSGTNIHPKNAWTLGWLLSVVALLSLMGQYS